MLEDAWVKNMAGKPHYIILRQHIMQVSRNCLYNYALHTEDLSYESYYYYYCYYKNNYHKHYNHYYRAEQNESGDKYIVER